MPYSNFSFAFIYYLDRYPGFYALLSFRAIRRKSKAVREVPRGISKGERGNLYFKGLLIYEYESDCRLLTRLTFPLNLYATAGFIKRRLQN